MIDLSIRPKLVQYTDNYYGMLKNNIKDYIQQGKNVTLFSFCKHEGDERAIQELMNRFSDDIKAKIKILKYDGNIEYFLREYSKMEYMICSRFHAMILSSIMNQKCKILSYSNKIDNVIKDLNLFTNEILHFDEINCDTKMLLATFQKVDDEIIKDIKSKAIMQLSEVDKSLT